MLRCLPSDDAGTTQESRADRVVLDWTGEPDRADQLSHYDLLDQAGRAAATLVRLGVRSGDRVAVHLPLVPESVVATLACGHLQVVRTTLSVSLSAAELALGVRQSGARVLITADGGFWDGELRPAKRVLDRALALGCHEVRSVLVVNRISRPVSWTPSRDQWWHEALADVGS